MMFRKAITIVAVTLLLSLLAATVYAEERSAQIDIRKDIQNCVFQINWENTNASATVVLKSPDGKEYGKEATPEVYSEMIGSVAIFVGTAKAGRWHVTVTGDSLGKITASGGELPEYIKITNFVVTKKDNDIIVISWETKDAVGAISFSVFADKDNSGRNGVQVASFSDAPQGSREISINNLSTGEYYFYLRAEDGNILPDYLYDDTKIWIENINIAETAQDVSAILVNDEIFVTWQPSANAEDHRVMFFENATNNLIFSIDTQNNWYAYPFPTDVDKIDVAVAIVKDELSGPYTRITVSTNVDFNVRVDLPEQKVLNTNTMNVPVEFPEGYKLDVFINNAYFIEGATKTGDYAVTLADGENHVGFVVTDEKGNKKSFEEIYYVDTYPPQLQITTNLDGKRVTTFTVLVAGKTEPVATVNVNGHDIAVDDHGNYHQQVRLKPGRNTITITAMDAAENESIILMTVTLDILGSAMFYLIAGSIIFIVLAIYYLLMFIRAGRKNRKTAKDVNNSTFHSKKDGGNAKKDD
jgi:hypothetical protein